MLGDDLVYNFALYTAIAGLIQALIGWIQQAIVAC
jgi:hypothetical protein